jgi:hypothetical protein
MHSVYMMMNQATCSADVCLLLLVVDVRLLRVLLRLLLPLTSKSNLYKTLSKREQERAQTVHA